VRNQKIQDGNYREKYKKTERIKKHEPGNKLRRLDLEHSQFFIIVMKIIRKCQIGHQGHYYFKRDRLIHTPKTQYQQKYKTQEPNQKVEPDGTIVSEVFQEKSVKCNEQKGKQC